MSETSKRVENNECEMVDGKRSVKLTAKALANKVESLQKERKMYVNKIKDLIPAMKGLMKSRENAQELKSHLKTLTQRLDCAVNLHQTIIPLLPEDEKVKQNEWFSSIEKYSSTFKNKVTQWMDEMEHVPNLVGNDLEAAQDTGPSTTLEGLQDEVKPSDSISNVESRRCAKSATSGKSSGSGKRSSVSGTSSARIKAEADLAALMARQKLLQDKHALEEEEQQIRKRKEKLMLDEEIAASLAKVSVLRAASTSGSKHTGTERSNAMNSYLREEQRKTKLNIDAAPFVPHGLEKPGYQLKPLDNDQAVGPEIDRPSHATHLQPPASKRHLPAHKPQPSTFNTQMQPETIFITEDSACSVEQNNVLDIMRRQNEITTLLVQQQQRSSLPKRDIHIFDGDPLHFHAFMRAFENGVESKSDSSSDCLHFLEQFTRGRPRDLVRSCQHMDPARGYAQAKILLQQNFGDEQRIAAAYIEKALSWAPIKSEDVKALQDFSLFLRGCLNAMNEVQYMFEMNMPANMLTVIKKLPL